MERTDVPRSLLAVLHKGMSANPADRFATAVDFARALQRVELELSYSQTPVDVPNLLIKAPERDLTTQESDPEQTKVRSIATVHAQEPVALTSPVITPPTFTPPPGAPSTFTPPVFTTPTYSPPQPTGSIPNSHPPVSSETVVRAPHAPTLAAEQPVEASSRRKNGTVISVIAGLVVIAAVILGIVLFAPKASTVLVDPDPVPTDLSDNSAVVGDSVPSAELVSAEESNQTVTFTWSNPSPEDGDTYLWQRTDGAASDHKVNPTSELSAVIEGFAPGTTVCISVDIRRANGSVSANPLEACYPQ